METESSLSCAQNPTTSPYHEPHQSSAKIVRFFNFHFNIILPSKSRIFMYKWMTTKSIWCHRQKTFKKTYFTVYEFREYRLSESLIYLRAWMNFYPDFPHLLSEMGKFLYKRSADYFVRCFGVWRKPEQVKTVFLIEGENQIKFTRVPWNLMTFWQ
jgi:hypothetical protein